MDFAAFLTWSLEETLELNEKIQIVKNWGDVIYKSILISKTWDHAQFLQWFGWEVSFIDSWIWTLAPQLLLFAEVMNSLGYGALIKEVCHFGQTLGVDLFLILSLPVCMKCGQLGSCSCHVLSHNYGLCSTGNIRQNTHFSFQSYLLSGHSVTATKKVINAEVGMENGDGGDNLTTWLLCLWPILW